MTHASIGSWIARDAKYRTLLIAALPCQTIPTIGAKCSSKTFIPEIRYWVSGVYFRRANQARESLDRQNLRYRLVRNSEAPRERKISTLIWCRDLGQSMPPDGNLSDGTSFDTVISGEVPPATYGVMASDPDPVRAVQLSGCTYFKPLSGFIAKAVPAAFPSRRLSMVRT